MFVKETISKLCKFLRNSNRNNLHTQIDNLIQNINTPDYCLLNNSFINNLQNLHNNNNLLDDYLLNKYIDILKEESENKMRKRCECHWSELIIAKLIKNPLLDSYEKVLDQEIEFIENEEEYIKEFNSNKEEVELWFNICKENTINWLKSLDISSSDNVEVYLTGKKIKSKKINDLTLDIEKKQLKADIYMCINEKIWIGVSVKKDTDCTLSNWSIEKIINERDEEYAKNLQKIKLEILEKNGITREWRKDKENNRKIYNEIMYGENAYKTMLNNYIINNTEYIKEIIAKAAGSIITDFEMFVYDGKEYKNLLTIYNKIINCEKFTIIEDNENTKVNLEERNIKSYYSSNAAKLWYYVEINNVVDYRFEIRWKGDPFASPQIQLFKL